MQMDFESEDFSYQVFQNFSGSSDFQNIDALLEWSFYCQLWGCLKPHMVQVERSVSNLWEKRFGGDIYTCAYEVSSPTRSPEFTRVTPCPSWTSGTLPLTSWAPHPGQFSRERWIALLEKKWQMCLQSFYERSLFKSCANLTDGNYTYCGEHCSMYGIVSSLSCTSETNITLYVGCISIINFFKRCASLLFIVVTEAYRDPILTPVFEWGHGVRMKCNHCPAYLPPTPGTVKRSKHFPPMKQVPGWRKSPLCLSCLKMWHPGLLIFIDKDYFNNHIAEINMVMCKYGIFQSRIRRYQSISFLLVAQLHCVL